MIDSFLDNFICFVHPHEMVAPCVRQRACGLFVSGKRGFRKGGARFS